MQMLNISNYLIFYAVRYRPVQVRDDFFSRASPAGLSRVARQCQYGKRVVLMHQHKDILPPSFLRLFTVRELK